MRTRGSELGRLLGEEWLKRKYKKVAEEAAYSYQAQAWGPLVRLLEREEGEAKDNKDAVGAVARGKLDAFMKGFNDRLRRHREGYCVPDLDLRKQITEAVAKVVVPAYAGFLRDYSLVLQVKSCVSPESIEELLGQLFDGGAAVGAVGVVVDGRRLGSGGKRFSGGRGREWRNRVEWGGSGESPEFRKPGRGNVGNV
ncbi:hypothetical protein QJS04_geneDACA006239 [Acorus gramineus]|uniref:Exocyst subunit Exo70 family protein n=1 Tax=Acorus gramineus TaxID=55184 RepID=A0AAV9AZ96_ACOGR|nr:hypothetical protein QJS04_geneDACA006239 [Acorus gramineus]